MTRKLNERDAGSPAGARRASTTIMLTFVAAIVVALLRLIAPTRQAAATSGAGFKRRPLRGRGAGSRGGIGVLVGLVALALGVPLAAAGAFTFAPAANYDTGGLPNSIVVGDLDSDGFPDLVVANYSSYSNSVSVLLGNKNGDGTFPTRIDSFAGGHPTYAAVGNFNSSVDAIPDLAVANSTTNNVSVLLGTGGGAFEERLPSPYPAGSGPHWVAVGDLNGDGNDDLAVANYSSGTVSVLVGDGNGGFVQPTGSPYPAGGGATSVAVGDLNRDGMLDLAVTNFASSGTVSVLLGKPSGGYEPRVPYVTGKYPWAVTVGDLNEDSLLDLAVANYDSNSVSLWFGDGAGNFRGGSAVGVGGSPQSVAIGDLNRDGHPDLAVANSGSGNVTVLLGTGVGGFTFGGTFATGTGDGSSMPAGVVIADLNADTKPDLAVANNGSNNLSVLLSRDPTPPVIAYTATGSPGTNGWYRSDVRVSWTVSDPESTITNQTGCDETNITSDTDTSGTTLTCSATSEGGTSSKSITIKRDVTAPSLMPTITPNPVYLHASPSTAANGSDPTPGSGLNWTACETPDTSSIGIKIMNCTATDIAGNSAYGSASYTVQYKLMNFTASPPNEAIRGRTIAVQFQLGDVAGTPIAPGDAKALTTTSPCRAYVRLQPVGSTATTISACATYSMGSQKFTATLRTTNSTPRGDYQLVVQILDSSWNVNTTASMAYKIT